MRQILIAVEDALGEFISRKLIREIKPSLDVSNVIGKWGNSYFREKITGLNHSARAFPILVLTDLDNIDCAPDLLHDWLEHKRNPNLLLRVAVREIETWLLAHRTEFARFLGIPLARIPESIEAIDNPKEFLIGLARKSRFKNRRESIVPLQGSTAKIGRDYNGTLIEFVGQKWNPRIAAENSNSLARAIRAIERL